ncbi:MAG: Alcohol dehydrogenase zinc-binding domain protein [Ramlibacter sp.]|nr:Alcohol dehydrogenase zinc-binding domain protein [Ramlibacter sp.]MDB5913336.1 Alcohol dehydrogenase zinc-binding domain protein [Ramlibacter sp.]
MKEVMALRVHRTGGPEAMQWEPIELGVPGPGEALVRHSAVGLNFLDTYFRSGLYPVPLPFVPGAEAAGVVEAVGAGVTAVRPGERVAYAGSTGAYSQARVIAADALVKLPDDIADTTAAAVLLQGMTARFLIREVYQVQRGETILLHAAAGGVGSLLAQWATALGACVIGTVSSQAKAEVARANGCAHVVVTSSEDFVQRVLEVTEGRKLGVVYDSVGRDTFAKSLDCLRPRGTMVVFGQSSGNVDPLEINLLGRKGSLYLTRPVMPDFVGTPQQRAVACAELFQALRDGVLQPRIGCIRPLAEAVQAHQDLEARRTAGATVFTV